MLFCFPFFYRPFPVLRGSSEPPLLAGGEQFGAVLFNLILDDLGR
jgi:hypothetical protein